VAFRGRASIGLLERVGWAHAFDRPLGDAVRPGSKPGNDAVQEADDALAVDPAGLTATVGGQGMTCGGGVPALTCKHAGPVSGGAGAVFTGGPAASANSGSTVGGYPVIQGALAGTGDYAIGTFDGGTLALSAAPHLAGRATSHFGGNEPAKSTNAGAERVPHAKLGHVKAGFLFGTGGEAGGRGGGAPPDQALRLGRRPGEDGLVAHGPLPLDGAAGEGLAGQAPPVHARRLAGPQTLREAFVRLDAYPHPAGRPVRPVGLPANSAALKAPNR
jgi:hypothetical protein